MEASLISLSINHIVLVYIFIVLFAFAEGPFLSLISGVLIKLSYFSFVPVYIALMAGDLIGDTFWYYVGFFYGHGFIKKFGKYLNITEQNIEKVENIFHKHKHPILFISKVTTGFGFGLATLITAGMVKIPLRIYLFMNLLGQFVWTGLLIGIGYFFGDLYIRINDLFGRIFIFTLFIFILVAFMRYIKYIKKTSL